MFGYLAISTGILGLMLFFGLITPADGRPRGLDEVIAMSISITVCFFAFLSLFIGSAVNLSYRQKPILFIRKEGIEIRTGGVILHSMVLGVFGFLLLPFELCWKLFTGRMIQTQIMRLPWEYLFGIDYYRGQLDIIGFVFSKDGQWIDENPFSFGADAFGMSTKTGETSLLYYANDISERENLPSWEQTGEIFEMD